MRRRRNRYRRRSRNYSILGSPRQSGRKLKLNIAAVKTVALWVVELAIAVALAGVLVFYFGVRVPVMGQSMSETLESGEVVLMNRFVYNLFSPKANDVVVFYPNGNTKSHAYIKRVIAVPGDTVQIIDGVVYVNDEPFPEVIADPYVEQGLLADEPITVGEDEYFVLGDNRNNSEDSRYANIGNVKREHIQGKAWFLVSPLSKLGSIK